MGRSGWCGAERWKKVPPRHSRASLAGGIENRILHMGGWGKIHVTGANQFLAMNERVGNFGDDAVCDFGFHRGADLVNFRNAKLCARRKCCCWRTAASSSERSTKLPGERN